MAGLDLGSVYGKLELKTDGFDNSLKQAEGSMGTFKATLLGVFAGNVVTSAIGSISSAIKSFGTDAIGGGAKLSTLTTAINAVAKNSGVSNETLSTFNKSLENMNILGIQAKNAMLNLLNANIPLDDSTVKLAQSAQNLATAYGKDTSTTFDTITDAITSLNTVQLSQYGITENLDIIFDRYSRTIGKSSKNLTEFEKRQALINLVNEKGAQFAGVYADAQGNVGKKFEQLGSRLGTIAAQLGTALQPALLAIIAPIEKVATSFAKWLSGSDGQKALQEWGIRIKEFGDVVANLISFLAKSAVSLYTVLRPVGEVLISIFSGAVATAIDIFAKSWEFLGKHIEIVAVFAIHTLITALIALLPILVSTVATIAVAAAPWIAFAGVIVGVGLVFDWLAEKLGGWGKIWEGIKSGAESIVNIFKLFKTGDFQGGIFNAQEDGGFIDLLFRIRDAMVVVYDFVAGQFSSIWESLKSIFSQITTALQPLIDLFQEFWSNHGDKVIKVLKYLGIALLGIVVAPLVIAIGVFMVSLKILAVVLGFVAKHFQIFKAIVVAIGVTVFMPLIVAIGLLIVAFKYVPKVVGAIIDWLVNAWQTSSNAIEGAIRSVTDFVKSAWDGVTNVIKKIVTTIANVISSAFNGLVGILTTIFTSIYNAIVGPITLVFNICKGILQFILDLFVIVFGSIFIVVVKSIQGVYNLVVSVWQSIWSFLQPILQSIWDFIVLVFVTIKDIIVGTWQSIYNFIAPIIQAIADFIISVWGVISSAITTALNAIKDVVVSSWNFIYSVGYSVFNAIKDFLINVWNVIYNTLVDIVNRITNFFTNAWNFLYNHGRDIITGLVNGIKSMFNALVNIGQEIISPVINFFKDAGKWLFDSGKALFQGFIDGILNIKNKVQDTAKSVMSSVRDLLPFSPAKVGPFSGKGWTLYSGQSLMQGFADGISGMKGTLNSAVASTLQSASSRMADLSGTVTSNLNVSSQAQAPIMPTTTSQTANIYGDITISSPESADRFFDRLGRKVDLANSGMIGV